MPLRNTTLAYGSVAKFFHWLLFLLILCQFILGYSFDNIPKDFQSMAYNVHKLTGLSILGLMFLRGLWALYNPKPLLPLSTRLWEHLAERLVHFLLYFTIIATAVVAWIGSATGGKPPHLGDWKLGLPLALNKPLTETLYDIHDDLAIVIIVLVSIHILAALFHYIIRGDNILQRMMPGSGDW